MRFLRLCALVLVSLSVLIGPTFADTASQSGSITGTVVDSITGFPLGGAIVTIVGPSPGTATTGQNGKFVLNALVPGQYSLRIQLPGYQTTLSDQIPLGAGTTQDVTLSMLRIGGGESIRTLGRTTIHASQSLQRSAIVVKEASVETVERTGAYRIGDYLRTLPQINASSTATGGGDNPAPGDDLYLDIRGIGSLETEALIDGHPIGYGINRGKNFGYDFTTAPTFAFRTVDVVYGSGVTGLMPYSAIGGVVNMLTLQPTPQTEANFTQGWGTFNKLVTTVNATGTYDRLGYAMAAGTQGVDGPYKNIYPFQPTAAFDPSAPPGTLSHDSGIYKDDTSVVNRGDFIKLRYALGEISKPAFLTLSAVNSYYWDDKTGNGDQDFMPFDTALATGKNAAAGASCFTPSNGAGGPWGTGPDGKPDGGLSCVTPQQYANIVAGLQGGGTAWQSFTTADYNLRYDQPLGKTTLSVDGFTNRWFQLYDRTFQLPFSVINGDNAFNLSPSVNTTGGAIEDTLSGTANDIGVGFAYNNYAYLFKQQVKSVQSILPSPVVHDESVYIQDVYHPANANYRLYFNGAEVNSSLTKSTYFDPRLAFVDNIGHNNTVRLAGGLTAVQPYATMIDIPYTPVASAAISGTQNCSGLTSIGTVANPNLAREKANDQELSIAHTFVQDSQVNLTLYSENINGKLFNDVIPVIGFPPGIIPAGSLTSLSNTVDSLCGKPAGTLTGVGVSSYANIGRMLAQGIDLTARARVNRQFFMDFNYSTESVVLKAIPVDILQSNLTYIVGAQLPGVPLHKGQVALDYTFPQGIDVHLQQNFVAQNNSKNSSAYNYGEFVVTAPIARTGTVNIGLNNVWNQGAFYNGLIGHGVPLALNQYATPSSYSPTGDTLGRLIGAQNTELFGLPFRTFFMSYTFHAH